MWINTWISWSYINLIDWINYDNIVQLSTDLITVANNIVIYNTNDVNKLLYNKLIIVIAFYSNF